MISCLEENEIDALYRDWEEKDGKVMSKSGLVGNGYTPEKIEVVGSTTMVRAEQLIQEIRKLK